jgi:hypothetical protein
MTLEEIKRNIRAALAGRRHGDREIVGLELYEAAAGEEAALLRCDRGTATLWLQDTAGHGGRTLRDSVGSEQRAGETAFDREQLAKMLKAAGLTPEQAVKLAKKDVTFADYKKIMQDEGGEAA